MLAAGSSGVSGWTAIWAIPAMSPVASWIAATAYSRYPNRPVQQADRDGAQVLLAPDVLVAGRGASGHGERLARRSAQHRSAQDRPARFGRRPGRVPEQFGAQARATAGRVHRQRQACPVLVLQVRQFQAEVTVGGPGPGAGTNHVTAGSAVHPSDSQARMAVGAIGALNGSSASRTVSCNSWIARAASASAGSKGTIAVTAASFRGAGGH
jgi:hypothetical protein